MDTTAMKRIGRPPKGNPETLRVRVGPEIMASLDRSVTGKAPLATRSDVVRAILEKQSAMSEWQPIATAPKNETDVLLFGTFRGNPRPPLVAGWFERHTDVPGWYSHDDINNPAEVDPSHWMPLPEAPQS